MLVDRMIARNSSGIYNEHCMFDLIRLIINAIFQ